MPTANPHNRIRDAARYMERHGKCEGMLRNQQGNVCLIGALVSANSGAVFHLAYQHDRGTIEKFLGFSSLASFSDREDEATVIETLKAAADWAEGLFG